jgi:hypothetical protein
MPGLDRPSPAMTPERDAKMDDLVRLLLRVVLVPLGYFTAVTVGTLVIVVGSWKLAPVAITSDPDAQTVATFGFIFLSPVLLVLLLSVMWLPGSIGILIAEAFAIRSFLFHAGNGAATAWVTWSGNLDVDGIPLTRPLPVIAAGLAGGLAYWAIAGWNAGFWKPVFRSAPQPSTTLPLDPASPPPHIHS